MRAIDTLIRSQSTLSALAMFLPLLGGCSGSDDDGSPAAGGTTSVLMAGTTSTSGGATGKAGAGGSTSPGGSFAMGGSAGSTAISGGPSTGGASGEAGSSNGGDNNGGDNNGGDTNGGDTNGGDTNGGDTNGGDNNGGDNNGGDTNGGDTNGGDTNGGASPGSSTDAKTILEKFKPSGDKAAGYETWLNTEIGTPIVATEAVADGNIKAPLLIPEGATYDGMGQTIKPSIPRCDGSQTESQPPVFILAPGATLKNVTIIPPGCDGVHMMGDNTLDNITWTDVGEDAASTRSYFPGGKITIKNSSAKSADDKVFQFNAPVQVTVQDFTATNISKMIRQNGGSSFSMSVDLINVKVSGCKEAVVRSDTSNCKVTQKNVSADCTVHLIKKN